MDERTGRVSVLRQRGATQFLLRGITQMGLFSGKVNRGVMGLHGEVSEGTLFRAPGLGQQHTRVIKQAGGGALGDRMVGIGGGAPGSLSFSSCSPVTLPPRTDERTLLSNIQVHLRCSRPQTSLCPQWDYCGFGIGCGEDHGPLPQLPAKLQS